MVHHWQQLHGKPGKKHNREWHARAQELGLVTSGPKGDTTAGPEFDKDAKAFGFKMKHIIFRHVAARARQEGKMKKWTCPGECNGSVRSGKAEVYLQCMVCGEQLEPAE